jgi:uncharacterized membrane protein YvlD (DUF360 family)
MTMRPRAYILREMLGGVLFPIIFVIVCILLYPLLKYFGLDIDIRIYLLWSLFTVIATVITIWVTAKMVFRRW